jgi:serine/threonine protein kinase
VIGRRLGHYLVQDRLGSGGMGEVYLAEDTKLGRKVALKVLLPRLAGDPQRQERFRREAKAVAALKHPNIVTIHAVEEAEGLLFLVLELVEGETLRERIDRGRLAVEAIIGIGTQIG